MTTRHALVLRAGWVAASAPWQLGLSGIHFLRRYPAAGRSGGVLVQILVLVAPDPLHPFPPCVGLGFENPVCGLDGISSIPETRLTTTTVEELHYAIRVRHVRPGGVWMCVV